MANRLISRRTVLKGAAVGAAAASARRVGPAAAQQVAGLPAGMALVSSPRLPLFGVGSAEVSALLSGSIPDWREVGSAIALPVEPLALGSSTPVAGAATTVNDYEALAAELDRRPGAVALVPIEHVDFRANVLAVDGYDPVRHDQIDGQDAIRVGVVGDIVPGRNVNNKMVAYGDYTHPFRKVAAELSSYDVMIANLEGNLSNNIAPPEDAHTFSFVSSPQMVDGFKLAGIDAVTLANNHSMWNSEGWGAQGLLDTIDALQAGGVPHFGAGNNLAEARAPWVAEVGGKTIAFFGIDGVTANEEARDFAATVYLSELGNDGYAGATDSSPGTNPYITEQFLADIESAVAQYDIVIPYFHMGIEYFPVPPAWAREGAKAAIDRGATMVVTNHPHIIQGMQVYNGKPILYSVGNFIFDQMFSVEVRQGNILEIVLRDDKVVGLRVRGVEIENFNQPRLMTAGEHASQMDRFWSATERIAAAESGA
ncbi:MAG: CapA family protein [Thermomicrobiales bacterium]|nr:CapA family protein [Thermomicrobiales bacterium]